MLKNFKSGYAVSGSDQTAKVEKNDCVESWKRGESKSHKGTI